jgi:hypothetical protein
MRIYRRLILLLITAAGFLGMRRPCNAQRRPYFGVLTGVSTLSADSRTALDSSSATTSSYKPENGLTTDAYLGLHWSDYFSIQGDYLWNRNLLTMDSLAASTIGTGTRLYEVTFQSRQHTALGSALLYFRPRSSWVRPFLSVGGGVVHLSAEPVSDGVVRGLSPPGPFRATKPALHVAVGIDLKVNNGWGFRYSFAETSSSNPITQQLTPQGSRMLANFRNLFGVVKYF